MVNTFYLGSIHKEKLSTPPPPYKENTSIPFSRQNKVADFIILKFETIKNVKDQLIG